MTSAIRRRPPRHLTRNLGYAGAIAVRRQMPVTRSFFPTSASEGSCQLPQHSQPFAIPKASRRSLWRVEERYCPRLLSSQHMSPGEFYLGDPAGRRQSDQTVCAFRTNIQFSSCVGESLCECSLSARSYMDTDIRLARRLDPLQLPLQVVHPHTRDVVHVHSGLISPNCDAPLCFDVTYTFVHLIIQKS